MVAKYKVIDDTDPEKLAAEISEGEERGWELVTIVQGPGQKYVAFLRREEPTELRAT